MTVKGLVSMLLVLLVERWAILATLDFWQEGQRFNAIFGGLFSLFWVAVVVGTWADAVE